MSQGLSIRATLVGLAILTVSGCASPIAAGSDSIGAIHDPAPVSAAGEVRGQGTVLQVDGDAVHLCLGAVMESYPPQCSGPPITGWDWASVEQWETASGVTWGTYAVQGVWDGTGLTLTQPPIPLSLYDPPMGMVDPHLDEANPGSTGEAELAEAQDAVSALAIPGLLSSSITNGYLFVQVVFDDGAIQGFLNARFGPDVAVVQSALVPV